MIGSGYPEDDTDGIDAKVRMGRGVVKIWLTDLMMRVRYSGNPPGGFNGCYPELSKQDTPIISPSLY